MIIGNIFLFFCFCSNIDCKCSLEPVLTSTHTLCLALTTKQNNINNIKVYSRKPHFSLYQARFMGVVYGIDVISHKKFCDSGIEVEGGKNKKVLMTVLKSFFFYLLFCLFACTKQWKVCDRVKLNYFFFFFFFFFFTLIYLF